MTLYFIASHLQATRSVLCAARFQTHSGDRGVS